ncbi:MAG: hypothetical protein GF317_14895 [Candidatus Lokiarchaeota archaeon]|nr:hypothetical protein [Candidatus Lokiarchaeota archaeon]
MANKKDLTKAVAVATGMTQKDSKPVVESIMKVISDALESGDSVKIVNFGKFSVVDRAARKGRNPQTGEELQIPAKKAIKFKAGKALNDSVDWEKNDLDDAEYTEADAIEDANEEIDEIEDSLEEMMEEGEDVSEITEID